MKWNMKKGIAVAIALMLIIGGVFIPANGLPEENEFSIAEKIRSFMLENNPEALKGVRKSNENCMQEAIETNAEYYRQIGRYSELEKYKKFLQESAVLVPEDSFCFYPLITDRYAKQYADNFAYDSLIDSKKIWTIPAKEIGLSRFCYEDRFGEYESLTEVFDQKTIDFLKDPEKIDQMVKEQISEEIVDCKIVMTGYSYIYYSPNNPDLNYPSTKNLATVLYLKGTSTDYGIKIFNEDIIDKREPSNLECFKVYKMSEILNNGANYVYFPEKQLLDEKPTYDTEMQALMDDGLLQGTDKGAEPLKPMSRMEATTILVRALGLENEPVSTVSQFSDIEEGSWGVKYANIAYDKGITRGVGDGLFAPDERISADQFATLVLRNSQTEEFDWTQAVNLLIENGIITQENADTMDLFTRADMAKIIFEAREKGLI